MKKSKKLDLNVEELKKLTTTELDAVVGGTNYTQGCGPPPGGTSGVGTRAGLGITSIC